MFCKGGFFRRILLHNFMEAVWRDDYEKGRFLPRAVIRGGHPVSHGATLHREAYLLTFFFFTFRGLTFRQGRKGVSENQSLSS